ncbi:hypothetical protein Slala04_00020 [Streptomyces lavendulae subsp. lavendulae]|nr:hypothetical protein Slala04_00020 [Streptomyces lavendulae subsp. lavendulae]
MAPFEWTQQPRADLTGPTGMTSGIPAPWMDGRAGRQCVWHDRAGAYWRAYRLRMALGMLHARIVSYARSEADDHTR